MTPETIRQVHNVLKAARARIAERTSWTTKAFARTKNGRPVGPISSGATCWCAVGALRMAAGGDDNVVGLALDCMWPYTITPLIDSEDAIILTNDTKGHTAILEVFSKAIEATKEQ